MSTKWFRHKALCREDMEFLAGTDIMVAMQTNRLVIIYHPNDKQATTDELKLSECQGCFYMRALRDRNDTYEILFQFPEDLELVEQALTYFKMGQE